MDTKDTFLKTDITLPLGQKANVLWNFFSNDKVYCFRIICRNGTISLTRYQAAGTEITSFVARGGCVVNRDVSMRSVVWTSAYINSIVVEGTVRNRTRMKRVQANTCY